MAAADFFEAQWELLVLLTTANFPAVMLPAYSRNRAYAAFFVTYVCFGVFFLLNYVLAVIYAAYTAQQRLLEEAARQRRVHHLAAAFEALDAARAGALSR